MDAVDAKIAAAEARTDTKFAELLGEMRLMNQRLDHVEKSTSGMRSTVIGTGIGVVAVAIAVMAYGAQWFGVGMDAQQVSERAAASALSKVEPKMNSLDGKLDQLLQATRPRLLPPQQ
jgi:RNA 3'-terminal phosphate cyclase